MKLEDYLNPKFITKNNAYLESSNQNGHRHRHIVVIAYICKYGFGHHQLPHAASLEESSNDCPVNISAEAKRDRC